MNIVKLLVFAAVSSTVVTCYPCGGSNYEQDQLQHLLNKLSQRSRLASAQGTGTGQLHNILQRAAKKLMNKVEAGDKKEKPKAEPKDIPGPKIVGKVPGPSIIEPNFVPNEPEPKLIKEPEPKPPVIVPVQKDRKEMVPPVPKVAPSVFVHPVRPVPPVEPVEPAEPYGPQIYIHQRPPLPPGPPPRPRPAAPRPPPGPPPEPPVGGLPPNIYLHERPPAPPPPPPPREPVPPNIYIHPVKPASPTISIRPIKPLPPASPMPPMPKPVVHIHTPADKGGKGDSGRRENDVQLKLNMDFKAHNRTGFQELMRLANRAEVQRLADHVMKQDTAAVSNVQVQNVIRSLLQERAANQELINLLVSNLKQTKK